MDKEKSAASERGLLVISYSTTATPPYECSKQHNGSSCCKIIAFKIMRTANIYRQITSAQCSRQQL